MFETYSLSTKYNGFYQDSYTWGGGGTGSTPVSVEFVRAGATDPVAVPVMKNSGGIIQIGVRGRSLL